MLRRAVWLLQRPALLHRLGSQHALFASAPKSPILPQLKLFGGAKPNATRRQQVVATTVREALDVTLASGIIKDRGFADGAAVHVLDVQVTKDAMMARVLWEPMSERYDAAAIQRALSRRRGILKQHVNSYVNKKWAIHLEFVAAPAALAPIARSAELFDAVRADLAAQEARRRASATEDEAPDPERDDDDVAPPRPGGL